MSASDGSDSADRNSLLPVALAKYETLLGESITPEQVIIIGDSPADVECASVHGARCLAVSTGASDRSELQGCGASWAVSDLSDTQTVLGLLFDEGQYE